MTNAMLIEQVMATAKQRRARASLTGVADGERLLEYAPTATNLKVDRNAGIIFGVKIIGHKSKWGHEYEQRALREAVPLYENRPVNIDHHVPTSATDFRKFEDGFGEMRNVRAKPDGLYGDLHYFKSHPLAEMAAERAERFPGTMGMSHDAMGNKVQHRDGRVTINKINKVRSVDLVCEGATTSGLFESKPSKPVSRPTVPTPAREAAPSRTAEAPLELPPADASREQKQAWLKY